MRWHRPRALHPAVPALQAQLHAGQLDRRAFLRTITLLGVRASVAYAMAGLLPTRTGMAQAQSKGNMGGNLRCSMRVKPMPDPAIFDWGEKSNQARHILEYLTITGRDNITRPYLAESWEVSADLKVWTFKLRQGVRWSNGDILNADDVVYNFTRWLDPRIGSSNLGLFDAMVSTSDTGRKEKDGQPILSKSLTTGAVEKIDEATVRLHLNRPVLAIPENLYHYPCAIVHRRFDDMGADFSKHPIGTGAYRLQTFVVGEKCVLTKRPASEYWGPEAYLESITYVDHGDDPAAHLAALASRQVDMVHEVGVESLPTIARLPHVVVQEVITSQTGVARMQVTQKPFDDLRVRQAVQLCVDQRRLLDLAHRGKGEPAEHHHVAASQPDYAPLPPLRQDHARARQLLAEAGYPNGLTLSLALGAADTWHVTLVQAFKEMCAPAGITLQLNVMPGPSYWEVWDKVPFGFTGWTHRPLGVMTLELGYRSGVPWNESKYANPAFDHALDLAAATLDVQERRKHMASVQRILQHDAVIAQPFWRSIFSATTRQVQGYATHPSLYHHFNGVWLG
ncbi:MAG: ABC transporter substrate-binding protein [Candidatus Tectomicrobia bacterium]|uniref:ABC transporter substrate-binding protein n=1 Tax=Tectimicrobiota bacterium TaxID=2528274 RepID=A0A938B2F3_UNCTE|nr:ABC transporter substrate-binding protein [Candidatus Tectomicrobia bacterium]